ncbi:MAG: serine hydrolase domain-containing protein [Vicinamibacterales bacterium]
MTRFRIQAAGLVVGLAMVIAGSGLSAQPQVKAPLPQTLLSSAAALPQLRSLIVVRRGERLAEYYARGIRATTPSNIKSASKSLIATLVGIALERRLIPDLHTPIVTWFPELRRDRDRRKQAITVEDLLTMRAGLESTSGRNYGRWVQSPNWVRFALARPMVADPGDAMQYSTGSSHILSALLTRVTGLSTWQFAQQALARPLGFTLARWPRDPQGIYFGGNDMLLTPTQMVAVGEMWLARGRANGTQVVPAAWVDTSCVPRTRSVFDNDREYGYGWWMQDFDGRQACFAWGYGGQYIFVFRDLDLVITATSSTAVSEERRGHRRQLFDLITREILSPIDGRR